MATICFSSHPVTRRNLSFPNPPYSSRTLVQIIKPTMFFGQGKLSLCSINYAQCHQGVWNETHFQAFITFVLYGGEWSDSSLDHSSSAVRALARPMAGLDTVVKGIEPQISSHPSNIHPMLSVFWFDIHIWSLYFRQFQATNFAGTTSGNSPLPKWLPKMARYMLQMDVLQLFSGLD
jgi:hypothetical protein